MGTASDETILKKLRYKTTLKRALTDQVTGEEKLPYYKFLSEKVGEMMDSINMMCQR